MKEKDRNNCQEFIDKIFEQNKEKIEEIAMLSIVTGFPIKCSYDEEKKRVTYELIEDFYQDLELLTKTEE